MLKGGRAAGNQCRHSSSAPPKSRRGTSQEQSHASSKGRRESFLEGQKEYDSKSALTQAKGSPEGKESRSQSTFSEPEAQRSAESHSSARWGDEKGLQAEGSQRGSSWEEDSEACSKGESKSQTQGCCQETSLQCLATEKGDRRLERRLLSRERQGERQGKQLCKGPVEGQGLKGQQQGQVLQQGLEANLVDQRFICHQVEAGQQPLEEGQLCQGQTAVDQALVKSPRRVDMGVEEKLVMELPVPAEAKTSNAQQPLLFEGPTSKKVGLIQNKLELGIFLQGEILKEKGLSTGFLSALTKNATVSSVEELGPSKDVLPLPLPSLEPMRTWLAFVESQSPGKHRRQAKQKKASAACKAVWLWLVVFGLNYEFCGGDPEGSKILGESSHRKTSAVQDACLKGLRKSVALWSQDPLKPVQLGPIEELFKKNQLDYSGEEVTTALPLVAGELLPGLPEKGVAGTVKAVEVVSPEVAEWLLRPYESLLPKSKWPEKIPKARMNCSKVEWENIVRLLWERGMIKAIPKEEIFHVDGQPVLNGAFAVEKKGCPSPGFQRITRFIVNLVPSNSYQQMLETDLGTLTPSTHWGSIYLGVDESLIWSSDDQKGAFYVFTLPDCWLPFMAFQWPVQGSVLGHPEWGLTYVACSVIPMGWCSAVSLFQHIHRRLGMSSFPLGAGHNEEEEWRRDRKTPITLLKKTKWVQFYLDDFDCPEIVDSGELPKIEGTIPPTQLKQRAAYVRHGIQWSSTKAVHRQTLVERMGAEVDGSKGSIRVPPDKAFTAAIMILYLLSCPYVHLRCLQGALGRLMRVFEFRRPLFGTLNNIWTFGRKKAVQSLSSTQKVELLVATSLLPLAVTDLRAPISGLVTASDASEKGGGCCKSTGLTCEGFDTLLSLQSNKEMSLGHRPCDSAELLPCCEKIKEQLRFPPLLKQARVLVVGLFDGIAGLLCALSRLPVLVIGFASSEIDPVAKKLVRKRWPGVIELGNIQGIDFETINKLAVTYAPLADLVIIGAGSPCQDLSGLLADRQGLLGERSKLFFEVPRILNLFRDRFPCVHFFVENVFSMDSENRAIFSEVLGVKPYLVDAVNFTYCRRPRLFWCSWAISTNNANIVERDGYYEVFVRCQKLDPSFWVEPGCSWENSQGYVCTLTRALPNSRPPKNPAGISTASNIAIQRWEADSYCFQVYQYEDSAMVTKPDSTKRLPSIAERELLMGFDLGYTKAAMTGKETPRQQFVMAAQLIGNSFCVPVISFLVSELLLAQNHVKKPLAPELGLAIKLSPGTWSSTASFKPGESETQSSKELVWEHLRTAERGGSDVRLDVNIPFRPKAWPRAGIRSSMWHWAIIHGYRWRFRAHINVLEMQAALNAVKWRARKIQNLGKRFLHLIDSQVCAAILTKGRTGSKRIRRTIKKINAYTLACNFFPAYGYVNTDDNPADIPSRWGARANKFGNNLKQKRPKPSGANEKAS